LNGFPARCRKLKKPVTTVSGGEDGEEKGVKGVAILTTGDHKKVSARIPKVASSKKNPFVKFTP